MKSDYKRSLSCVAFSLRSSGDAEYCRRAHLASRLSIDSAIIPDDPVVSVATVRPLNLLLPIPDFIRRPSYSSQAAPAVLIHSSGNLFAEVHGPLKLLRHVELYLEILDAKSNKRLCNLRLDLNDQAENRYANADSFASSTASLNDYLPGLLLILRSTS